MFKVRHFIVRAFDLAGSRPTPTGEGRVTRDEAEAEAWAREMRDRLQRKAGPGRHEVMVYSVIGEPMFDLWEEPTLRSRYRAENA